MHLFGLTLILTPYDVTITPYDVTTAPAAYDKFHMELGMIALFIIPLLYSINGIKLKATPAEYFKFLYYYVKTIPKSKYHKITYNVLMILASIYYLHYDVWKIYFPRPSFWFCIGSIFMLATYLIIHYSCLQLLITDININKDFALTNTYHTDLLDCYKQRDELHKQIADINDQLISVTDPKQIRVLTEKRDKLINHDLEQNDYFRWELTEAIETQNDTQITQIETQIRRNIKLYGLAKYFNPKTNKNE